ncbi:MAG: hypothetical protein II208_02165, partial [Alphaproteobacteria bacterium]|nr:hypothetical protein [Alphaproteobacteria bacterium]
DDGFYMGDDNVCVECPIGYSGSDAGRDSINDCFINCVNHSFSNGIINSKTEREYWNGESYNLCEYDIFCDPGYFSTGKINSIITDTNVLWVNPDVYLRSNGEQYLDTGVSGNNDNLKFEVKYEWVNMPNANEYLGIFGNYNGNENANVTRLIQYGNTRIHYNLNTQAGDSDDTSVNKNSGVIYVETLDKSSFVSKNIKRTLSAQKTNVNNDGNILLFAEISSRPSDIKIYYFKVWDGGNLIRYMVPVNTGMVIGDTYIDAPGMWDVINKKFYRNKGKGNFVYGGEDICNMCNGAVYSPGGNLTKCISCPDGYNLNEERGKTSPEDCTIFCASGTYVPEVGDKCKDVGIGFWGEGGILNYGQISQRNMCPDGLTSAGYGAAANEKSDCGKALNLGNTRIVFGKTKKTKRALAAMIDGEIYYGAMSSDVNTINTIKVLADDGLVYSLHDDNSVDNVGLTAGKLLWVDENTYLASDGYQYINTGVPGNNANLSFKIKYAWTVLPKGYEAIFANYESETANITRLLQSGQGTTFLYVDTRTNAPMARLDMVRKVNTPYIETLDFTNYSIGNKVIPLQSPTKGTDNTKSILLLKGAASEHPKLKIYYFKVYDNGKLVRNFVPVQKDAKIGDFIVPENGMWDIVEQKFYKNAGTGSFTYGYGG